METLMLSVRCTREEFTEFHAHCRSAGPQFTIVGVMFLVLSSLIIAFLRQTFVGLGALCVLLGLFFLLLNPVILPVLRKGAAARMYDASDFFKQAMTLTINEESLSVRSACHEGDLPLSLLTAVHRTPQMIALSVGNELTVYIPVRAMPDEELTYLNRVLSKKELSV